jgi:hypothetical protein
MVGNCENARICKNVIMINVQILPPQQSRDSNKNISEHKSGCYRFSNIFGCKDEMIQGRILLDSHFKLRIKSGDSKI